MTSPAPGTSRRWPPSLDLVGGQHPAGREPDADTDGDVDQEDPVPVEQAGQDATGEHAHRAATRHHEPEEAHRLGPLGRVGEQAHDQGECDRGYRSAAQALDGAADDEEERVRGESAGDAGGGERDDTSQEDAFVAEEVSQPSREQQEAAEGQHVGVDHPGQRGLGEPQVGLDGRQRDVHDVGVEHDHQVTEAQHVQRQPAGLLVVHGLLLLRGVCHPRHEQT